MTGISDGTGPETQRPFICIVSPFFAIIRLNIKPNLKHIGRCFSRR